MIQAKTGLIFEMTYPAIQELRWLFLILLSAIICDWCYGKTIGYSLGEKINKSDSIIHGQVINTSKIIMGYELNEISVVKSYLGTEQERENLFVITYPGEDQPLVCIYP